MAAKYLLDMRVYPAAGPCIASGEESDEFGDHAIVYSKEGERIYNVLRDALHETAAKQAYLALAKEQSTHLRVSG